MLTTLSMIGMPGPTELIILAAIVFILVVPKKLPSIVRSIGSLPAAFRAGKREGDELIRKEEEEERLRLAKAAEEVEGDAT